MMRGGIVLILGRMVKCRGQLWHSAYKTLWAWCILQFLPNHFHSSRSPCWWWEEEPFCFWVMRSKVNVNFGTVCIKPCEYDTDYNLCRITFKLHMHIVDDERSNPIDLNHEIKGQCQFWHSVLYKTLLARYILHFLPNHFQLHRHIVDDERRNAIDFRSPCQRSRSAMALCV